MDSAGIRCRNRFMSAVMCAAALLGASETAVAQRVLGLDVSYWQSEITQAGWNTAFGSGNRKFVMVRSSRGGTTGLDQPQGTPGGGSISTLSRRYDDPRFVQNMVRANNAGLFTAPYHFARADIAGNTGADEADHFMQAAGAWMRPGYMLPMYDLEAGQAERTQQELAQFSLDFSNRIYDVMKIRPSLYANGNYMNDLSGANLSTRNALAQPSPNAPSVVSPAFPVLVAARYPAGSGEPYDEVVYGSLQTQNPKDAGGTLSWFFGPFDDYGNSQPWNVWQYSSGESIPGLSDTTVDGDVAQGDMEFVKDMLIPAVWWNDSSGDWSTMLNWNSGQPVVAPIIPDDQADPYATGPLPTARLPGAAGSGPTAGSNDTVILERPNANITVTVSTGTHNVRKLYMRETLNITGGSLTINYDPKYYLIADPDYDTNPDYPNALHSGPISAQFSGAVTLSGGGALSVHTLQVDATRTFTLSGGTLTFNTINLMPHSTTPAKILVTGDVTINPLVHSNPYHTLTATIANGGGAGSSGLIDLGGSTRMFIVGNSSANVDLDVAVPITNGGLHKAGSGTMLLSGANTFSGPVTVSNGTLRYGHASGLSSNTVVKVNNLSVLDMNGFSDTIAALASDAGNPTGSVVQGAADLTLAATSGSETYLGTITGTGTLTKNGGATQILTGNNSLGPVVLNDGMLLFNGTNTTGPVTVNGGTLGGTGSVSGAVTVNAGATVSPGASIESLNVGSMTLNAGATLDFEIDSTFSLDRLNVTGLLTINGGSINVVNAGGLDYTTYTLIDYGTLGGSVANLGTPTGPEGFAFELVDTGSLIQLVVTVPALSGDFNEDGVVDAADYVVWRKTGGTQAEFNEWRSNFGATQGGGSGGGSSASPPPPESNTAVPEPAAIGLVAMACISLRMLSDRRRSSRRLAAIPVAVRNNASKLRSRG